MIHLTGTLTCTTAQDTALVAKHVTTHITLSRAEPGCLSFSITPSDDGLIWHVDETFADQAAFDAHQTRTRASEWFAATGNLPRAFTLT